MDFGLLSSKRFVRCTACGLLVGLPLAHAGEHQCRPPAECPPLAPEEHIEQGTANNSNDLLYGSVRGAITANVSSTAMPVDVSALKQPFFFNPNGGITLKSTSGDPVVIFVRTDPSSGSVR